LITHYLGREEVEGYARDIASRLDGLGENLPTLWCPVGRSGDYLARIIGEHITKRKGDIQTLPVAYDKNTESVVLDESPSNLAAIRQANSIFIFDSSIHSGSTMLAVVRKLKSLGAKLVLTYSLVIKQGARFVPHFFGVVVGDHDRVFFLLKSIPNNRLFKPHKVPFGILRAVSEDDCAKGDGQLDTGVDSIDKITWSDLVYQQCAHGHDVYVIEVDGQIASYVSLRFNHDRLLIDVVAADKKYKDKGLGGALLRWAETLARSRRCSALELWAISTQVDWYSRADYKPAGQTLVLGKETYQRMTRKLLYSFDLTHMNND
jgi:GNAT superfamily N-acetyltransferase